VFLPERFRTRARLATLNPIEITQAVADNAAAERQLLFNPGNLPSGIEPRDPMIKTRAEAYPISYNRRTKNE
jgi:catalase